MKKIFTLLALLISLGLTSEIIATNLQVASSATGFTSIDGKGVATFVVKSPVAQSCDLSFLMMPGEYEDGSFTSVSLKVNGVTLPNPITFNTYGWQPANTTGNAVTLNEGDNTVQFISGRDDVPMIKSIKIGQNRNDASLLRANSLRSLNPVSTSSTQEYETGAILGDCMYYGFSTNQLYAYTSAIQLSYPEAGILNIYAPTSGDPLFGPYESTIEFNLYLFNSDFSYSETISSNNKYVSWQTQLPAGDYTILIEAQNPEEMGGVTLRLNTTLYRYNFASNTSFGHIKHGYASTDSSLDARKYNIFTCNLRSGNEYEAADPILWLKKFNTTTNQFQIVGVADNYTEDSDFEWRNNARFNQSFDSGRYSVLLASNNPYYFTTDTCDMYYAQLYTMTPIEASKFPLLKSDDAIVSHGSLINVQYYNCIAWSARTTTNWLWPHTSIGSRDIRWFDMLYNNQPVHNSDGNFYQRDTSLPRYTRDGANAENSAIDLWGFKDENGRILEITHASIKHNSKDPMVPHGYDWESKDGPDARFFHPRRALSRSGYGEIIAHYRLVDNAPGNIGRTIQQQVAEGNIIVETIELTDSEMDIIDNVIANISLTQETNFDILYDNWKQIVEQYSYKANLWAHKDYPQYSALLTCMQSIGNGEYLAYKKFANEDIFAMLLIQDFAYSSNDTKDIWDTAFNDGNLGNIKRSQKSKVNLFIQNMIEEQTNIFNYGAGRNFSNTDDFNVTSSSNTIKINIEIEETSSYRIEVVDLSNNYVQTVVPEIRVQAGEYEHTVNVPNGIYVVVYYLNGNINSKKIQIK